MQLAQDREELEKKKKSIKGKKSSNTAISNPSAKISEPQGFLFFHNKWIDIRFSARNCGA